MKNDGGLKLTAPVPKVEEEKEDFTLMALMNLITFFAKTEDVEGQQHYENLFNVYMDLLIEEKVKKIRPVIFREEGLIK